MTNDKGILIKNIYYMLTYAFQSLRQSNYDSVATEDFENIHDMFAAILGKGVANQLKQGMYKEYILQSEELSVLHDCEQPWTMWRKIAIWTQAIHNAYSQNMCEYDEEVLRSHEKEIIDRIAVVNVKKSNGENSSNYEDLEKYAIEDQAEIKRELEIIRPDIIVCGNNCSLLKIVLGDDFHNEDTWDNMLGLWKDTLVIDYYHPAVHYPNRVNYYALMSICDVAKRKYGTPF